MNENTITLFTDSKEQFETLNTIILNSGSYEELDVDKYSPTLWIHHYYAQGINIMFSIYVYESRLYGYENK